MSTKQIMDLINGPEKESSSSPVYPEESSQKDQQQQMISKGARQLRQLSGAKDNSEQGKANEEAEQSEEDIRNDYSRGKENSLGVI